jgi:hypothetical protein
MSCEEPYEYTLNHLGVYFMKFNNEHSNIINNIKSLNNGEEIDLSISTGTTLLKNSSSAAIDYLDLMNIDYNHVQCDDESYLNLKVGDLNQAVQNEIKQLNSSKPYLSSWLPFKKIAYITDLTGINSLDIIEDNLISGNIFDRLIYDLKKEQLDLTLKTERNGVFKFYDTDQEIGFDVYLGLAVVLNLYGCKVTLSNKNSKHNEIISIISHCWDTFSRKNEDLFFEVNSSCYVRQFIVSNYLMKRNFGALIKSDHWFKTEEELMKCYSPLLKEWNESFPLHKERLDEHYKDLVAHQLDQDVIPEKNTFISYGELIRGVSSKYLDQGCTDYEALEGWDWNWLETISLRLQINCEIATEDCDVFKDNDNALLMAAQTPIYSEIWLDVRFLAIYNHLLELWSLDDVEPEDFNQRYTDLFGENEIMEQVKEFFLMPEAELEETFYKRLYEIYPYIIKAI